MSMFTASVPVFGKMLLNLDVMLAKAQESAKERGFDVDNLASFRLAPDQFPLTRQVMSACDSAKLCVARLSAVQAPVHEDTQSTIAELRVRIASTLEFIQSITEAQYNGAAGRTVTLPWMPGVGMSGAEYLNGFALPNFYFHVTTAYAILRHNGVNVGKRDYIGSLELFPVPA